MNTLDYLIKQNDQISMSIYECDNINTNGQDESNIWTKIHFQN